MTATGQIFTQRCHRRQGFTLTELAIVMGLIGTVLGVIWVVSGNLRQQHMAQQAGTQILTITNNFHALYGAQHAITNSGTTDVTGLAIKNGFLPPEMIVPGNDITGRSPWNTNVIVQTNQSWNAIIVTYQTLTRDACNRLAATVFNNSDGLVWTSVNGTARTLPPLGTDSAFTVTDIDGLCSATVSGTQNYVSVAYNVN